jgi:hypothetical protein
VDKITPIFENWLTGTPLSANGVLPAIIAQQQLKDWDEKSVRGLCDEIYQAYEDWKIEHGLEPRQPMGLLADEITKEEAKPWACAGPSVNDAIDLLRHLESIQYQPIEDMVEKHGKETLLSILILKELVEDAREQHKFPFVYHPAPGVEAALKGTVFLLVENSDKFAQAKLDLILPRLYASAKKHAVTEQTRRAAQAKNQKNTALKEKAIELYSHDPSKYKSPRQAAKKITPTVQEYGRTHLGYWLTSEEPWERVYRWLLDAKRDGLLKS